MIFSESDGSSSKRGSESSAVSPPYPLAGAAPPPPPPPPLVPLAPLTVDLSGHMLGAFDNANVPYPRTSGARFSANGQILVCFGRSPHQRLVQNTNSKVVPTPRALSAYDARLHMIQQMDTYHGPPTSQGGASVANVGPIPGRHHHHSHSPVTSFTFR